MVTRKPCPACKEVDPYRKADDICNRCKRLIKEAKQNREWLARDVELIEAKVSDAAHLNEGYYSAKCNWDLRDWLSEAMRDLAISISIPNPNWGKGKPLLGKCDEYKGHVYIQKPRAAAIRRVHFFIKEIMKSCYQHGYKDGHNLLIGLAQGSLSIKDFNARTKRRRL